MMDSCLAGKPDRFELVEVDDIKRNLLDEFSFSPAHVSVPPQTENLQVYLRVRPFTAAESHSRDSQDCMTIEGSDTVALRAPRISSSNQKNEKLFPQTAQRFTFTQVFGPDAGQRQVFNGSVRGLVRDVLQGGNCLVFTYGVTNAGKTFTFLGPEHDSGLLPRSLSVIFNSIEDRLYSRNDLKPQRCKDFSRLTTEQQAAESSSKRCLLRLFKETDKTLISGRSTFLEGSSLSSDSSSSISEPDSFCLDVSSNIRFSVWVSFCEIYNETIHDLLEQVPAVNQRRTVLRLSQDVKGNSFIKDLRWVQVNSSEEAYRIMKIGKRNQSFSSTRLNYLSSRSHSIFSIRILRVDDSSLPRVLGVSELALCDLAGSERCSRTQNTGERLKEAGNINSSLLTLGKCINAMRLNQNSKFQHHVPFRESKLTHFLQNFFCGAGRVSMVVNINQSSSFFDETLNVLKFSALAQKVVVLSSQPEISGDSDPHKKAMELSIIIDEAEERRNQLRHGRKSSLIAWETSLEDLQEDEDGEEEEEEESMMEGTVLEAGGEEEEVNLTMGDEEQHPGREAALRLVLEAQIREEVSTEFMELFKKMEKDYSERLEKEREILEERADKKVEILMKLVGKTVDPSAAKTDGKEEKQKAALEEDISSMSEEREKIQEGAQSGHHCVAKETQSAEMEELQLENQRSHDHLQETLQSLEQQEQKFRELIQVCRQKEEVIVKLQAAVEKAAADKEHTCSCMMGVRVEEVKEESCKRQHDSAEESGGPAKKRVLLEEEIWRLQEENENKEKVIAELQKKEERRRSLEEEVIRRNEEVKHLKEEQELLEQKVLMLTDLDACQNCASVLASLEAEQRESARLQKENKALVNGIFQLQTEVTGLQEQLNQQTVMADSLSEQLNTAKSRLQDLESQLEEKSESVSSFRQEVECLKLRVKEEEGQSTSVFHATMEELMKESKAALQRSAEKSQQIEELQGEKIQLEDQLKQSLNRCEELTSQLASQRAELLQLQTLKAELGAEDVALLGRLQEMERSEVERRRDQEKKMFELQEVLREKDRLLDESLQQTEGLRRELQRLKEDLQKMEEEEKENRGCEERIWRRQQQETEGEEEICSQDVSSPLRHNRRKSPKAVRRKRKSVEVEDLVFSENKRNRGRGGALNSRQEQKVASVIFNSPSISKGKGKTTGLVEAVTTKSRRGRKKLLKTGPSTPLLESPQMALGGTDEDRESDHLIIQRKLRSKTYRK